jgi:hypothetical protein
MRCQCVGANDPRWCGCMTGADADQASTDCPSRQVPRGLIATSPPTLNLISKPNQQLFLRGTVTPPQACRASSSGEPRTLQIAGAQDRLVEVKNPRASLNRRYKALRTPAFRAFINMMNEAGLLWLRFGAGKSASLSRISHMSARHRALADRQCLVSSKIAGYCCC